MKESSIYCRALGKEWVARVQKTQTPQWLSGKRVLFFKINFYWRLYRCLGKGGFKGIVRGDVISLCIVLRLVDIKVKFQASSTFGSQQVQGLCACGHCFLSGGGLHPLKTTWECVRPLYLLGNCEISDSAM